MVVGANLVAKEVTGSLVDEVLDTSIVEEMRLASQLLEKKASQK